jgi:hypothetical protein
MKSLLSVLEIKALIIKAGESFRHQECASCECYLGYLTQLEIEADQEGQKYIRERLPDKDQQHSCLGCDPCPPGVLYSNYLRKQQTNKSDQ